MSDIARLERRYRRLLACYPKAFRQEHEQEILTVLLATAEQGRRRVALAESAALLRGALWMRLRPFGRPPRTVQGAIRLMLVGATSYATYLIIALAFSGDRNDYRLRLAGHAFSTAELVQLRPLLIMLAMTFGLGVIALWLWIARATSQGRIWARSLATGLFGLATLELTGNHGGAEVFPAVLTWLTGLATVWLLWRPACSAYFKAARTARSRLPSQVSGGR